MLTSLFAQTNLEGFEGFETTTTTTTTDAALGGGIFLVSLLFFAVFYVVMALSINKILKKAGHPNPWAGWVPVYNGWAVAEVAGRPGWWALVGLLGAIPVINFVAWIAVLIVQIIVSLDLAKSFGKGGGFAALLILVPIVGFPMLGFGDAQYQGAAGPEGNKFKDGVAGPGPQGMNGVDNNTVPQNDDQNGPQAPTHPTQPTV